MKVTIVDAGMGNLRSVERALLEAARRVGRAATLERSGDPDVIRKAEALLFPGQGAFRDCAAALDRGLREALLEALGRGAPYFGICLGMQALFARSEEADASCRGLGLLAGHVAKLRGGPGLKIPHMGWNTADPAASRGLLRDRAEAFYFVHSYAVVPEDPSVIAATTEHGERFVSAVHKDNVFAVQFHPEKSQGDGLALLGRFLEGA